MRRLLLLVALITTSCDDTVPTASGTAVIDFKPTGKLSVSPWSLGAPQGDATKVDKRYRFDPGESGAPLTFELAVESGPSALGDPDPRPDKPATALAPRSVRLVVTENSAWALTGSCDEDLAVPLAVRSDGTSAYPASVWARCRLVMKRKNGNITLSIDFDLHGDGKIEPSVTANAKLEELR